VAKAGMAVGSGDHGVSEALYVDDPDGNGVELYRDRPRDQWPPPAPGERVGMYTVALDLDDLLAALEARNASDGAPRIGHVHLQVSDLERTLAFYVGGLGLDLMARMGHQAAFMSSNGYHHHIGANVWNSRGSAPASRRRAGLSRIVLRVDDVAELDKTRRRLEAEGHAVSTGDDGLATQEPDAVELIFMPSAVT
jgi:catechol 2,3-dioxygenase